VGAKGNACQGEPLMTTLFTLREVAAHLGLTVNGVRSHLHRQPGLFQARYRFNSEPPRRLRVLTTEEVRTLEGLVALAGPWRRQRWSYWDAFGVHPGGEG
jgi:hypothetical protein